ncbi:MAG: hypothetical protein ACYDDB_01195 [bacterium]
MIYEYVAAAMLISVFFYLTCRVYKVEDKDDADEVNIMGFGKANGVYLVKAGKYYIVAGKKIKTKKTALKRFIDIVEANGYVPPNSFFKMVRIKNYHD